MLLIIYNIYKQEEKKMPNAQVTIYLTDDDYLKYLKNKKEINEITRATMRDEINKSR